jgi:hypothetical protein
LWDVCPALLSHKLEDAGMSMLLCCTIYELQHDGPLHVQLGNLVERRRREEDLGAVVELWPLGTGGHDHGVTSVVLVESLYNRPPAARHLKEVLRVAGVKPAAPAETVLEFMLVLNVG